MYCKSTLAVQPGVVGIRKNQVIAIKILWGGLKCNRAGSSGKFLLLSLCCCSIVARHFSENEPYTVGWSKDEVIVLKFLLGKVFYKNSFSLLNACSNSKKRRTIFMFLGKKYWFSWLCKSHSYFSQWICWAVTTSETDDE